MPKTEASSQRIQVCSAAVQLSRGDGGGLDFQVVKDAEGYSSDASFELLYELQDASPQRLLSRLSRKWAGQVYARCSAYLEDGAEAGFGWAGSAIIDGLEVLASEKVKDAARVELPITGVGVSGPTEGFVVVEAVASEGGDVGDETQTGVESSSESGGLRAPQVQLEEYSEGLDSKGVEALQRLSSAYEQREADLLARLQAPRGRTDLGSLVEQAGVDYGSVLKAAQDAAQKATQPVAEQLQRYLTALPEHLKEQGKRSFGDLETNQDFVRRLRGVLALLGMGVECSKCQTPASPECAKHGASSGRFLFLHSRTQAGDTGRHHGATRTMPAYRLIQRL